MALNELPNLYNKGTNKIKNKNFKKLLQSYLAKLVSRHGNRIWTTKIRMKQIIFITLYLFLKNVGISFLTKTVFDITDILE